MPTPDIKKIKTSASNLFLRVAKGHFATNHSHTNHYVDVVSQKNCLAEAKAVAYALCRDGNYSSRIVDAVLCLDGTEVIGACLADEITKSDFISVNSNQKIYVVTPEISQDSKFVFRDNILPMIRGKHVLPLAVSVATGATVRAAAEAVRYYGGNVAGIAAIFASVDECDGYPVNSVFDPTDLDEYFVCPSHECPLCRAGVKLDALINCHGYSKL